MEAVVRHYWMDLLNIVACFAVILLHCSTGVFLNTGDTQWLLNVVCQSICVFAVPSFFMISGANLLGYRKKYDTKTFFIKRFRKVVFTLCVASAIVYVVRPLVACFCFGESLHLSFRGFVDGVLRNSICDVYWFFYAILALYLVTPIFSVVADNKRLMEYAIGLSIFSTTVVPFLNRFTGDLFNLLIVSYLSGWVMYYLLGYYLQHHFSHTAPTAFIVLAVAVSCVFTAMMTLKTNWGHTVLSGSYSPYDNFYANASSLPVLIYSICIFLLFKRANEKIGSLRFYDKIKAASRYSLGIYAIHMLVINSLDLFVPHQLAWDLVLRPLVVFAVSFALSWIGSRLLLLLRTLKRATPLGLPRG